MNVIIVTPEDLTSGDTYVLSDRRARHISSVLHGELGQTLRIGLLNGNLGTGEITSVSESAVELKCLFDSPPPKPIPAVDLICAVPRPKTLRKVLYVSAMMGVQRIVLVRANRTDKSYLGSELLTPAGALPHLLDGLSQGGFTHLPEVIVEPLFRPFVEDRLDDLFSPRDQSVRLLIDQSGRHTVTSQLAGCDICHIVAAIGPEGGWVDFEQGLFEQQQFAPVTLGPWTLRVEYAVAALCAQLHVATGVSRS